MDSVCTEADIERIQQLGNSGKRQRFDQIGRFGLGMNTMYVFSDQPILRDRMPEVPEGRDSICFFDPLQLSAAKGLQKPGVRWEAEELASDFPGQLLPFDLPSSVPQSTVFRLPLRSNTDFIPPVEKAWLVRDIFEQLDQFVHNLPTWMCFLRSIENITVGRLRAGVHIQLLTELRVPLNKEWLNYRSKWPSDWESYAAESFTSQDLCACFRKSIVELRRGSSSVHDFIVASRLPADARDVAIEHCGETRYADKCTWRSTGEMDRAHRWFLRVPDGTRRHNMGQRVEHLRAVEDYATSASRPHLGHEAVCVHMLSLLGL